MSDKKTFVLAHPQARANCAAFSQVAPDGWMAVFSEPKRNNGQNAKFHAIAGDIAKSGLKWGGKRRTAAQWKVLLVSGHATATSEGSEMVPGLEDEFVNLRESTADMSKKRGASLIEYALAFGTQHDVKWGAKARAEEAA